MIRDKYKIVMEEFLTRKSVPRPILLRGLNMVRLTKLYYTESDEFTNLHGKLKDLITFLFFIFFRFEDLATCGKYLLHLFVAFKNLFPF